MEISILYEDARLIVCIKPVGIVSEGSGMPALLSTQTGTPTVYCIHRLDREVGGLMVFAKSQVAAAELSRLISLKQFRKEYLAVVHGSPEKQEDTLQDLLFHDRTRNKTYIVDRPRKGVKEASLHYRVISRTEDFSLLHIQLHTGRTHQIRAQFAGRKMPLAGDAKYGSSLRNQNIALWSYHISFPWKSIPNGQLAFSALPVSGCFTEQYAPLFEAASFP